MILIEADRLQFRRVVGVEMPQELNAVAAHNIIPDTHAGLWGSTEPIHRDLMVYIHGPGEFSAPSATGFESFHEPADVARYGSHARGGDLNVKEQPRPIRGYPRRSLMNNLSRVG